MERNVKKWLREICRWDRVDWFIEVVEDKDGMFKCNIYTHTCKYRITAIDRGDKEKGYLGCTVSNRTPRAGEDWTRGNDLPDGPYAYRIWQRIKNAILAYELVKVTKPKEISETVENQEDKSGNENRSDEGSEKSGCEGEDRKGSGIQNTLLDGNEISEIGCQDC